MHKAKGLDRLLCILKAWPSFNKVYKEAEESMNIFKLLLFLKGYDIYTDGSGFVSLKKEQNYLIMNAWFSPNGQGLKLWKFAESKAENKLVGYVHKNETKFLSFLKRKKCKFLDVQGYTLAIWEKI